MPDALAAHFDAGASIGRGLAVLRVGHGRLIGTSAWPTMPTF